MILIYVFCAARSFLSSTARMIIAATLAVYLCYYYYLLNSEYQMARKIIIQEECRRVLGEYSSEISDDLSH